METANALPNSHFSVRALTQACCVWTANSSKMTSVLELVCLEVMRYFISIPNGCS